MEGLDLKDRKILYHLDLDSRQSFRSLGKKVGLSKDVVTSRVKKLQELGIIKGFFAIIDYAKLGYSLYRFYLSFQNITNILKKEIIDYFLNNEYVVTVRTLEGAHDLMVSIFVKNYPQANAFWENILKKYGKYFSKRIFSAYTQEDCYAYRFLIDDKHDKPTLIHQWFDNGKRVEIDNLDNQIIKLISKNSRLSTVDIAKALDTTSTVVQYRLKKLLELNLIIAYRLHIDFSKLGYFMYKVDIELNQFDNIDKIINHIKLNPYFYFICKTVGYVDLEFAFNLNNAYQLHKIMEDLSDKFPDAIKDYSYSSEINTFKDYEL